MEEQNKCLERSDAQENIADALFWSICNAWLSDCVTKDGDGTRSGSEIRAEIERIIKEIPKTRHDVAISQTLTSSIPKCTCSARDLFALGCRCGYANRNKI